MSEHDLDDEYGEEEDLPVPDDLDVGTRTTIGTDKTRATSGAAAMMVLTEIRRCDLAIAILCYEYDAFPDEWSGR